MGAARPCGREGGSKGAARPCGWEEGGGGSGSRGGKGRGGLGRASSRRHSTSACGWCEDRWGFSWRITPRRLLDLVASADPMQAKRAFEAMMTMVKIDIAALEAAVKEN